MPPVDELSSEVSVQDAFDEGLVLEPFGFGAGLDLLKLRSGDADVHFGFVFFFGIEVKNPLFICRVYP